MTQSTDPGGRFDAASPQPALDTVSLLTPALFRAAMDASSIGAALSDLRQPDQPLVYVNPAFEQMTGYRAAEILGRNCRFLQGSEHGQPAVAQIREAIAARRSLTVLLRNYRKDGSPFWNELTLSPLYGLDGEVSHYVGFQRDATAEQEALIRIARSDAHSRALLDSAPAAMVAADLETHRIVYANPRFESLTGRPLASLIGSDPMLLHPEASRAEVAKAFIAMVSGGLDRAVDVPVAHPEGWILPVEVHGSHGELDGRPTVFAVFADQRARQAAEREAGRQLARLAAVLAAHPDEVLVLEASGKLVESLRPGWMAEALATEAALVEALPARHASTIREALQQVSVEARPVTREFERDDPDGLRHHELRLLPLPGMQILALIRDVTEARRAAQALTESEAEFRHLFETLPQGVVYQAADGQIIRANPAACRLLGLSMEQLLGRESTDPRWQTLREDGSPFPGAEHPAMLSLVTGEAVEGVTMGVYHPLRAETVWLLVSATPEFREGAQRPWRVFASFVDITARRRAAAALAQSQELFEQAGQLARIGAWEVDVSRGTALWSAVTKAIHEVPPDYRPTLADGLRFCREGESRERAVRAVERIVSNAGDTFDEEFEIETAQGNRRWVRATGRGVYEAGKCVRLYGTFQDITDRQQVLLELTRQSELQQLLMDIAATYINLPLEQLEVAIEQSLGQLGEFSGADRFYVFRYDFQRMVTSNTHEWCAPGIQPQMPHLQDYPLQGMEAWIEAHQAGRPMQIADVQALAPDDALRITLEPQGIRSMVALPLMHEGVCLGFAGMDFVRAPHVVSDAELKLLAVFAQMLVNVRMRQEMLRELTENRNFLADVIENSGSLISIKDLDGNYLSVNQRWESMYRLNREAVLGRTDEELFDAALAGTLRAGDLGVIRTGRLRESEEQYDAPDGTRRFYTVRFPVRDRDGQVYGIVGMSTDITERQRLEEERQARALAEAANREKSAFLAKMSHEIRTPLNAIIGFSRRLMDDQSMQPRSADQIRTVHRSATHLLGMINDLLDYSRIEAGRISLQEQEFDLHGMLDDLAAMIRFRCEEKYLHFDFHWDPSLPRQVSGDGGKLRQIVMNLLGNAVKFTDRGQVALRARRGAGDPTSFKLEIEVEDSGSGIAPEELPHLFDEFWQGEAGRLAGGTGLGLPIAQQLVKLLGGGSIQVQSEPGRGSSFRFLIPLQTGSVPEAPETAGTPIGSVSAARPIPAPLAEAQLIAVLAAQPEAQIARMRAALLRGEMSAFRDQLGELTSIPDPIRKRLLELAGQYDYLHLERLLADGHSSEGADP